MNRINISPSRSRRKGLRCVALSGHKGLAGWGRYGVDGTCRAMAVAMIYPDAEKGGSSQWGYLPSHSSRTR